jgi:hypothetical protein
MDEVTICNMALSHLLINRQIDDLDEGTQESEACSLWYERIRNQVLKDYPWPFAERFAELALVEEDPNFEWGYAYRAPSDFLAARRLARDGVRANNIPALPYRTGSDATGGLIFTDEPDATLVYTARIEDVTLFPEDFINALSLRLAYQISKPLSASLAIAQQAMSDYRSAVSVAQGNSENENQPDDQPDAECIRARES